MADEIPGKVLELSKRVEIEESTKPIMGFTVFYRFVKPPSEVQHKGDVLLLHGQSFTSQNWIDIRTPHLLAAAGYRTVAIDLPGYGKTGGNSMPHDEKGEFLRTIFSILGLRKPALISPSMSGAYALQLLMSAPSALGAFVPVAPVGTHQYTLLQYQKILVPTLIVYGERDTSLGTTSVSNLRALPRSQIFKIPQAGHAAYLNQPEIFHTGLLNFLNYIYASDSSDPSDHANGNVKHGI